MSIGQLYFSLDGRVSRSTFWLALAIPCLVGFIIVDMIEEALHTAVVSWIFYITIFYPSLAVAAKRWHDRNKSAWWILIGLIPIIGGIWQLIENGFLKGTAGDNKYGPDPLAVDKSVQKSSSPSHDDQK